MGFRYRKSINIGGGFRINLSKSGIGYSWGVKGYRITKTAKGTIRKTASIPGTGLSYVEETSNNKENEKEYTHIQNNNNCYDEKEFINEMSNLSNSESCDEILSLARKSLKINQIATIGMIISFILMLFNHFFLIPLFLFICLFGYVRIFGTIDLEYNIDDDLRAVIENKMQPMVKVAQSAKTWRILSSNRVIDTKYSAGATSTIKRINCTTSRKSVFPFKFETSAVSFITPQETIIFLPDKLFVIQDCKIIAIDYCDIQTNASTTQFVEEETIPSDANVIGKTWRYINKSGGPDRRFKNNREIPICLYGTLTLTSNTGLNTVIMFSNTNL